MSNEYMEGIDFEDTDGSGFSLTIPTYLIDRTSANLIKDYAQNNDIYLKSELSMVAIDNSIRLSLYYSSVMDFSDTQFYAIYKLVKNSLESRENALLDFHISTFSCPTCPK